MGDSTPFPSSAAIKRAEKLTRERFVFDGETVQQALAPGSARRRALDAALLDVKAKLPVPSLEWRREFSLMLGLERLLSDEEQRLADGTILSAHQVDALSGTLTALLASAQTEGPTVEEHVVAEDERPAEKDKKPAAVAAAAMPAAKRSRRKPVAEAEVDDDESDDDAEVYDAEEPEDDADVDDADSDEEGDPDEEPLDWQHDEPALDEDVAAEGVDDPGADRRFWFEHATGAGKTVAALGFVEASRTGGADPDPPPQPRRSVHRRAEGPRLP